MVLLQMPESTNLKKVELKDSFRIMELPLISKS